MIQARFGVFETNSSSTHTLQIVSAEEYRKLEKEELLLNRHTNELATLEEAIEQSVKDYNRWSSGKRMTVEDLKTYSSDELMEFVFDNGEYETLEHFFDEGYVDTFKYDHTTEHGDRIVVFGKYGWDG